MSAQSNIIRKISSIIRTVCNPLVRDFHEIQRLQSSSSANVFFQAAYAKVESALSKELRRYASSIGSEYKIRIFPIEGRINFQNGIPDFTVSVLLLREDEAQVCIVEAPMLYTTFYAEEGLGAYLEDLGGTMRMKVRKCADFSKALVLANCVDGPFLFPDRRIIGSDSLSVSYLGAARADILIYRSTENNSDIFPLVSLIAKESGAKSFTINDYTIFAHLDICTTLRTLIKK